VVSLSNPIQPKLFAKISTQPNQTHGWTQPMSTSDDTLSCEFLDAPTHAGAIARMSDVKQHADGVKTLLRTVADRKILKGGAKDNVSAPSSFIANTHNEVYMPFTREKAALKNSEPPALPPLPFESATGLVS